MQDDICLFTTLEFICSIFTVFLTVAQPHAGDAVPTWTSEVAFLALLPMGDWEKQQNHAGPLALAMIEVIIFSSSL